MRHGRCEPARVYVWLCERVRRVCEYVCVYWRSCSMLECVLECVCRQNNVHARILHRDVMRYSVSGI